MDDNRKRWNERNAVLRDMLESKAVPPGAVDLLISQHAALHSGLAGPGAWSLADEVLDGLSEEQMRRIPPGFEHSIAWVWWHLARIEDVTMNVLAAGGAQLADEEGWFGREDAPPPLGTFMRHTGNAMDVPAVQRFSAEVNLPQLLAYRQAVGRRTEEIVRALPLAEYHRAVEPARLQTLLDCGAVLPEAHSILDYWGKRDVAGLLLMPPTRHCVVHLNEALTIKKKL